MGAYRLTEQEQAFVDQIDIMLQYADREGDTLLAAQLEHVQCHFREKTVEFGTQRALD